MRVIMVEDRGDGELASVSVLLFFHRRGMAELSLIREDYTPNPADTEHTCARLDTRKRDTHMHTGHRFMSIYVYRSALFARFTHTEPYAPFRKENRPWRYADAEVMPTFTV